DLVYATTLSMSFFCCVRARRDLHSFPTRRSSDLLSQVGRTASSAICTPRAVTPSSSTRKRKSWLSAGPESGLASSRGGQGFFQQDRKSTRLNSSHDQTSYAVFCLKKKKKRAETSV